MSLQQAKNAQLRILQGPNDKALEQASRAIELLISEVERLQQEINTLKQKR
jgi:prefoldin subunit 5